ncbi:MAG: hypothetical protein FWC09_00470 [Lachnospiraceae bacterium]|nr:hypothetical protein [Lachnospiraceae bacterium]
MSEKEIRELKESMEQELARPITPQEAKRNLVAVGVYTRNGKLTKRGKSTFQYFSQRS